MKLWEINQAFADAETQLNISRFGNQLFGNRRHTFYRSSQLHNQYNLYGHWKSLRQQKEDQQLDQNELKVFWISAKLIQKNLFEQDFCFEIIIVHVLSIWSK